MTATKKIIAGYSANNLSSLRAALSLALEDARVAAKIADGYKPTAEDVCLETEDFRCVNFSLVEESLTDGSRVYNLLFLFS